MRWLTGALRGIRKRVAGYDYRQSEKWRAAEEWYKSFKPEAGRDYGFLYEFSRARFDRIIRGVEIQHDPLGRSLVLGQKSIHEELMDRLQMGSNLLVPMLRVRTDRRQFQSVERALARQGFPTVARVLSIVAFRICLPDQRGQQRIVPQPVVIVEVFITQAQSEEPLLQQVDQRMLDALRIAMIGETGGEPFDESESVVDLS